VRVVSKKKPAMENVQKVELECRAPSSEAYSAVQGKQLYFTILKFPGFPTLFNFILFVLIWPG